MKKKNPLPVVKTATIFKQLKIFKKYNIYKNKNIKKSGTPINKIFNKYLLYDDSDIHTLVIGTTASGKSRKHAIVTAKLAIAAKENMIFNDCKKEFYNNLKKECIKNGYQIYVLDFRNFEYSDSYNPLNIVIEAYERCDNDLVDELVNDLVNQLVVHNPKVEPIWENGERALLKAMILLVINAPIPKKYKNFYNVANALSYLSSNKTINNMTLLRYYFYSLDTDNPAKIAFGPLNASSDNVEMSLITSALTTLNIYTSLNVAKVTSFSDFNINNLIDDINPTALFIVNPDEKSTYNNLTALIYQQIYSIACKEANKLPNSKLKVKLNMIFDEFGNMPYINDFSKMITVARSRNIIFYLYVQDFSQMNQLYNENIAKVIRANCNCWVFIASSDIKTCKEVEEKIGYKYELIKTNNYHSDNYRFIESNINCNYQKIPLISYNELMQMNNQDGHKTIVMRTYCPNIIANLPDISTYQNWYNNIQLNAHDEEIRDDRYLKFILPHLYEYKVKDNKFINIHYWSLNKIAEDKLVRIINKYADNLDNIETLIQEDIFNNVER